MSILTVGLLGLAQAFYLGMQHMSTSSANLIAREKAREAVESVHTARDTRTITWAQIRNVVQRRRLPQRRAAPECRRRRRAGQHRRRCGGRAGDAARPRARRHPRQRRRRPDAALRVPARHRDPRTGPAQPGPARSADHHHVHRRAATPHVHAADVHLRVLVGRTMGITETRRAGHAGFTLVELLVAMVIVSSSWARR